MGKGRKKSGRRLGDWADEDLGEEDAAGTPQVALRGKAGRRQLSRKQQRRAAAGEDSSDADERPPPATPASPPASAGFGVLRLALHNIEGHDPEEPGSATKVRAAMLHST